MESPGQPSRSGVKDTFLDDFVQLIDESVGRLMLIEDDAASRPRAEGKWSRKEIMGHLIDSAINNHSRFVLALLGHDLVFDGYDQDAWVRVQRYQERGWTTLVEAWRTYNLRIAEVIRAAPAADLERLRRHNLHEIAFRTLPRGTEASLWYLIEDYVAHMRHHLRQVLDEGGVGREAPQAVRT